MWTRSRFKTEYISPLFVLLGEIADVAILDSFNLENILEEEYSERFTEILYDRYLIEKLIVNSDELKELIKDFYKFYKLSFSEEQLKEFVNEFVEFCNKNLPSLFGDGLDDYRHRKEFMKCNP